MKKISVEKVNYLIFEFRIDSLLSTNLIVTFSFVNIEFSVVVLYNVCIKRIPGSKRPGGFLLFGGCKTITTVTS